MTVREYMQLAQNCTYFYHWPDVIYKSPELCSPDPTALMSSPQLKLAATINIRNQQ